MALSSGARLGPYEITALLGAGGMGEVYRATDTNLKRAVAIKVLPDSLAADAERLVRFQREAEVLATLNHPHIAAIYGLERSDRSTALVMELVEGPTLADCISEGALPIDETIAIAKQIAEALEAAHGHGIVHRDLKPANIKVRADGTVKVLDFGLAKAMEPVRHAPSGALLSPTITSPAMMTANGMLLGTVAYMSPEQARGKAVDKRSDIWAFGAVVYEMLTGKRAFAGDEIADVLAAVLTREPDWTLLPAGLPPAVAALLRRCLHKDRTQRVRDAGDVWLALDGAFDGAGPPTVQSVRSPRPTWKRVLPLAATAIVAGLVTGLAAWTLWPPTPDHPATTRFEYVLPEGQELPSTQRPVIATSADGSSFIYQTTAGLYRRAIGDLEARFIPGTEEYSYAPIVSPDGRWVAYFAGSGQLKKMPVAGGAPVIVCAASYPFGASWARDNTIFFGQVAGIMRVSADGGTPTLIVPARDGEQIYGAQLLPGGRAILFGVTRKLGPSRWDEAQVVAEDLSSHTRTVVVEGGSDPRYLPTGHVIYTLGDGLYGVRFDAARLQPTSGPVPLAQSVARAVGVAAAASHYSVSDEGTLVYIAKSTASRSLVWVNRDGAPGGTLATIPPGTLEEPRLSPDGRRVLVTRSNDILVTRSGDIWVYDIASGRSDRITDDGTSQMGVWDPTGSQIAYSSARKGNLEAWVESSDGSGAPRQLTSLGGQVHVDSWSLDGRTFTMHHHPPQGPVNINTLAMDSADAKPEAFFPGESSKESAEFSRDRQYVSYLSAETGQREIYIRPYQKSGPRVTASVGGGREPVWARNGDLFYRSLNGEKMFSVSVKTAPTLNVGTPVQVFQGRYYIPPTGSPRAQYDVTADGKRFLMLAPTAEATRNQPRVVVVQHWFDEVRSKIPGR